MEFSFPWYRSYKTFSTNFFLPLFTFYTVYLCDNAYGWEFRFILAGNSVSRRWNAKNSFGYILGFDADSAFHGPPGEGPEGAIKPEVFPARCDS